MTKVLWLSPKSLAGENPQHIWSRYVRERGNFEVTYDRNDDYDIVFFSSDSVLDEELIDGDRYTVAYFWDFLSPRLVNPSYRGFVREKVGLMRRCDMVLVPSYWTRAQAFTLGFASAICYPGIDSKLIDSTPEQRKENQVCSIGILHQPHKQFPMVIAAASSMDPKPKAVIIGAGDPRPFERYAERLGVECKVGALSDAQKFTELKRSVCFVSPTLNEGFDMPVLEAAYAGVPVLALDTPTHREILKEYAVYFSTLDELVKKLDHLLKNAELRDVMSKRGREYVKRNFTFERATDRLESYLRYIAKRGPDKKIFASGRDWAAMQEEQYSRGGFGETGRALKEAEKPEGKRYIATLLKFLGDPPKRVLDASCNDGSITKFLKGRGYDVTGVDLPKVIERARELNPDLDLRPLDLDGETDNAPELRETFDGIYAGAIVEHMMYDVLFLKRMRSYLKPGGTLVLTTASTLGEDRRFKAHVRFYTTEMLRKIMTLGAGLEVIFSADIEEDHMIILVGRR